MNKGPADQSYFSLGEMKIDQVKEDLLIPNTNNPEKEAKDLTDDTGVYHYAVDDDVTGKKAIVRTNVNALNEEEWIKKTFYTPDANVIEPNNFDKTDDIAVSSIDHVAESDDKSPWTYESEGIYHHDYLPLCYDESSGRIELIEFPSEDESEAPIHIGTFDSVEDMDKWIKTNLKEEFRESFSSGDSPQMTTGENGVANNDGNNYGPAPTDDQNDLDFDSQGRAEIEEDVDPAFLEAARQAKQISKEEGVTQHINDLGDGHYEVSDWYDQDATVLSYSNGHTRMGATDPLGDDVDNDMSDALGDDDDIINNVQFDEAAGLDQSGWTYEIASKLSNMLKGRTEIGLTELGDAFGDLSMDMIENILNFVQNKGVNVVDDINSGGSEEKINEAGSKYYDEDFVSYVDIGDEEVEVEVGYDINPAEPDVGYNGGVSIHSIIRTDNKQDVAELISPKDMARLEQEAEIAAHEAADEYANGRADYEYDRMRDERFEEGKDWRHNPDADEDDYARQDRFKQRNQDKKNRRRDIDEAGDDMNEFTGPSVGGHPIPNWANPGEAQVAAVFTGKDSDWANDSCQVYADGGRIVTHAHSEHDDYHDTPESAEAWLQKWGYITFDGYDDFSPNMVNESVLTEDSIERVYVLAVTFNPDFAEIEHKGMMDLEAAASVASDSLNKERIVQDVQMGGLPASYVLNRDNQYTIVTLSNNLRDAIEGMISEEICGQLLEEIEISEDVFYGFIIQGGEGARLDDSTELTEDDEAEYIDPEFVMEAGDIDYDALMNDPDFQNSMKSAYDDAAEAVGQDPAGWDPDLKTVDGIISQGMETYPHGKKHSFVMTDQNSRDAVNAAFSALWDQGKIK